MFARPAARRENRLGGVEYNLNCMRATVVLIKAAAIRHPHPTGWCTSDCQTDTALGEQALRQSCMPGDAPF